MEITRFNNILYLFSNLKVLKYYNKNSANLDQMLQIV